MPLVPTIIYEDQRVKGAPKYYGPHEFLCACVADRTGRTVFELRTQLGCKPLKGAGNLKKEGAKVAPQFASAPHKLMMLIDNDQIREQLTLSSDACRTQVIATLRSDCSFVVILLEQNIEDLLCVVLDVLGLPPLPAKPKPTPLERDRILQNAAHSRTPEQRAEILRRMPSFERLVRAAVGALAPSEPG
jgi:hypothetical protein